MAFYGMRGTGDFVADQAPKSWREAIIRWFPNGDAPLTAMLSKMKPKVTTSSTINWWTKGLPLQAGTITGKYTDSSLSVAYTTGAVSGDFLYIKMSAADLTQFRIGHQVTLRYPTDMTVDVVGKIVARDNNGASSYVQVVLLEDDDNSTTYDLSDATRILVTGNMNAEGAGVPDSIAYNPTKWSNLTQIFKTSMTITGTAMEEELRTRPGLFAETQKDCLQDHSVEMEKAFLFSVPSETTGDNGKPERSTLGLIPAIRGGYTGHGGDAGTVSDYVTDSTYAGQSWLSGGEDWLNEKLEAVFRYGKKEKMCFCGSSVLMAINRIVRNNGDFAWGPDTSVYGIRIREWITPLGSLGLISHPLFNYEFSLRKAMVIFEPEGVIYCPLRNRDTKFIEEKIGKDNTGYNSRDAITNLYLTEAALEYHNPISFAYLTGFGDANTAS
ncbi:MAG: DUF5309 domain-containing protein [bacterium]|nr:DUF5309 domain-containing protein [bacterium]